MSEAHSRESTTAPEPEVATEAPTGGTYVEQRRRSVVKALSWRATGTIDTIVISFLITGRLDAAVSIGAVELITKITLFYLHERAWARIGFGRTYVPPKK